MAALLTSIVTYRYDFGTLAAGGNELDNGLPPSIYKVQLGNPPTGTITKVEYPGSSYTSSDSYMGISVTDVVSYTNQSNSTFLSISAATTGTDTTQPYAQSVSMPSMSYDSNSGVYVIESTKYCSSRMYMNSSFSKSAAAPPTLYAKLTNRNIVSAKVVAYVTYKVTYTLSYTITWELGSGNKWSDGSTATLLYTEVAPGSDATPPAVPYYDSGNTYTFNGWTTSTSNGATVLGKDSIPANSITGNMTLYPQWTPKVSLSSVSGMVGTAQIATLTCSPAGLAVTAFYTNLGTGTISNSNSSYFTTSITEKATSSNRNTYRISITLSARCKNKEYTLKPVPAMSSGGSPLARPKYFAAFPSTVTGSVTVNGKPGSTGIPTDDVHVVYGSPKTFTITASGNTSSIRLTASSDTSFAKVTNDSNTVRVEIIGNPGNSCTITVGTIATSTYESAKSEFKVYYDKADNPITISPTSGKIYFHSSHTHNNTVQVPVKNPQGTVSYSSSDTGKATVDANGLVTAKGTGTATITATAAGNTNYKSGSKTYTVTIVADTYTDTWNNPSISQYSYSNIGAGGGTSTPTVKASQSCTRNWVSGYSETLSNSTFNYVYSMTAGSGFSINTTNGNITAESRGTTTGSERSSNTATVTVTGSGSKSNTKTAVCKQNANALTSISISLGSSSINYNTTTTATVTATYTSGSSKDVTSSLSNSSSATSNYIKSGDTTIVTIS